MPFESAAACAARQDLQRSQSQTDRFAVAANLEYVRAAQEQRHCGLRPLARELGVPRSTLQGQQRAALQDGLPLPAHTFFESETGLLLLRRMIVVLLLVVVVRGGHSVDLVTQCVSLLGLRRLVACSPSSLRRLLDTLVPLMVAWGDEQRRARAKGMEHRDLVLAVDENFHWDKMLLVALDLATGYLVCEAPSESRDGETWEKALRASTEGLDVTICALGSDGAEGLAACARRLGVARGPDIFHVQQDACKGILRPLWRRIQAADQEVLTQRAHQATVAAERAEAESRPRGPGRPPDWDTREQTAQAQVKAAEAHAAAMREEHAATLKSIRDLSEKHHPVDLSTGVPLTAEQAEERLREVAEELSAQAAKADLGERAIRALGKVFRSVPSLSQVVGWWHGEVLRRLRALSLTESEGTWVQQALVPALYVRERVRLGRDEATRAQLRALSLALWTRVQQGPGPWRGWSRDRREKVLRVVQELVLQFPRSTSSVEGRNGQDSLAQHQHHRVSEAFRAARIVVHNDVIQRPDGTTAGERLFGKKPGDLLEYLCARITLPGRGRSRRQEREHPLLKLAA